MSVPKRFTGLTAHEVVSVANVYVPNNATKAVLVIFTDEVRWFGSSEFMDYLRKDDRLASLLELRAHNATSEFHALRSNVSEPFVARLRIDDGNDSGGFCEDEVQYLDVDTTAPGTSPSLRHYQSIAGGAYTLPVANATKVTVRNYYEYDDQSGLARLVDFRIVGFGDQTEGSSHA